MNLSGTPLDFLVVFFAGVLVSFSPCVFPLIPVTAGYIGASDSMSRRKGFCLSFVYVTGMAFTYALLGVFASATGKIFGVVSSYPLTNAFVGALFIVFGVSLLDWINLPIPSLVKLPALKKFNYFSTFVLGISSGFIVGPCTTPVLGSILVYLATKHNFFYGGALLVCFAYGMGLLLIIIGTFSAFLIKIRRFAKITVYIKRFSALVLIAAGIYYVSIAIRRF